MGLNFAELYFLQGMLASERKFKKKDRTTHESKFSCKTESLTPYKEA